MSSSADYQRGWKAKNRGRVDAYNAARRHDFFPKPCVVCGDTFKPRREYDRYCGEPCRNRRPRKPSTKPRRVIFQGIRVCPCGQEFEWAPRYREKFCSKECAKAGRIGHAVEWRCDIPWKDCSECSERFISPNQRVCSDECRKAKARRKAREAFVSVELTNPTVSHICPECGVTFISRRNSSRRKFCSELCSARVGKRLRRHLLRGRPRESVGIWEIGERDGWRCQLCNRPVDRALGFRHRMARTLDHIIPVYAGGCHLRTNLQLTHRSCNSKKGIGPAQLRWTA